MPCKYSYDSLDTRSLWHILRKGIIELQAHDILICKTANVQRRVSETIENCITNIVMQVRYYYFFFPLYCNFSPNFVPSFVLYFLSYRIQAFITLNFTLFVTTCSSEGSLVKGSNMQGNLSVFPTRKSCASSDMNLASQYQLQNFIIGAIHI